MYHPFLRGKQFELLAIRELVEKRRISERIVPIIEPLKMTSTFFKTLDVFRESGRRIIVVVNPSVGSLKGNSEKIYNELHSYFEEGFVDVGVLLTSKLESDIELATKFNFDKCDLTIVHVNESFPDICENTFEDESPVCHLIPDGSYRRLITGDKVVFSDHFNKQKRNADYTNLLDEFFSRDHLFYKEENYIGFSDYSIAGSDYSESGFMPYAVALHMVYFDKKDNLRIRHFVSDDQSKSKDIAKKFSEALSKLVLWANELELDTHGLNEFKVHFQEQSYPGLGAAKKYSIMHHLELISAYLGDE